MINLYFHMKLNAIGIILIGFLFLSGCLSASQTAGKSDTSKCGNNACESLETNETCPQDCSKASPVGDNNPTINATVNPSNPKSGQAFSLTITAEDDKGIQYILWESSKPLPTAALDSPPINADYYECNLQSTCSNTWEFISPEEGLLQISIFAVDSSDQNSGKVPVEVNVQPGRETNIITGPICGNIACEGGESYESCPQDCGQSMRVCGDGGCGSEETSESCSQDCGEPEPSCGNGSCEEGEAFEICPADCKRIDSICGNGKCEGGESYENCSKDCTLKNIIGTSCGDGACQPGEDADYCPKDCESIRPNCGNGVCDPWETRSTCYEDCPNGTSTGSSCSSNSDCGNKQKCKSGNCVTVDCTTDSQCAGCKRCSDNRCVRCGYGPYGCTC